MKILKFGGTSVGSASRIKEVASLVNNGEKKIVVLSAMSGTTNKLVEISEYLGKRNVPAANETINILAEKYSNIVEELYESKEIKKEVNDFLDSVFNDLRIITKKLFNIFEEKIIVSKGELMSTTMFSFYLKEQGIKTALLSSLEFMRIDKNGEPDTEYIEKYAKKELAKFPDADVYVTQGFICLNAYGEVDNLKRGGSDYSASLIGAAVGAEEIQIWTDIDGMHNNDPRFVENTSPVSNLNFEEAAELAYFGAKILHPTCVLPAKFAGIPVRLLNTMDPKAYGTMISNYSEKGKIKAVAAKDNITSIKIKSGRMLLAYGFLRKVFEIFESYKTSIDMICTSEVGVSLTIDDDKNIEEIVNELKKFGSVSIQKGMSIICVVGDLKFENVGFESEVLEALEEVPIRMISYGGSNYNISLLVNATDKKRALQLLSKRLFS